MGSENVSAKFELVCRHKDGHSSNLNQVFDSYGCDRLEAKVPFVEDPVANKLKTASEEQRMYATLALKAESASRAVSGRPVRTRNKDVKLVEINGSTMIALGPERERSPVDKEDLDNDIDEYMRQRRKGHLHVNMESLCLQEKFSQSSSRSENSNNRDVIDIDQMDRDLSEYMLEAARVRAQKKKFAQQQDHAERMARMEEEINYY